MTISLLIWHLTRNEDSLLALDNCMRRQDNKEQYSAVEDESIRQVSGSISRTLKNIKVHLLKVEENFKPAAEWYAVQVPRQPVVPLQSVDWKIDKTTKNKLAEMGTGERLF